jgi:ABC-type uncharacterized transport system YnjBCD ATPase subunit
MSVLELKGDILNLVSDLEDEELLLLVRELLLEVSKPDAAKNSEAENLSAAQMARLEVLRKLVRMPENQVPDEKVRKMVQLHRQRKYENSMAE